MNVGGLLAIVAEADGDRPALTADGRTLTYAELLSDAAAAASWLRAEHVRTLGYVGVNGGAFPIALFGAAWASVPFAPLNYRWSDERLRAAAARLDGGLLVADAAAAERLGEIPPVRVVERERFLGEVSASAPGADARDDVETPAVLLFTSGTSSAPKIAVLRHENLSSYILGSVELLGADLDEANLISVPPYHVAGIAGLLSSVFAGRRVVYLPTFSPDGWIAMADNEAITHAMVVPTMLARILEEIDRHYDSRALRLRHLSYGGGRMPLPLIEKAMRCLPDVAFVNAYGLTETSSTISVLGPGDHRRAIASTNPIERRRLGSVGRPVPSVQVEVRSPDGRVLEPGQAGEIWVCGPQVSGEYVGLQSARGDDGWLRTNDAGWLDVDGYLFVDGRLDDVIVRGAENISPGEVEDALLTHPVVLDAAVVGVPDDEWGETVAAVVVPSPGGDIDEATLQEWVRVHLRSSKVPSHIEFRSELPHNDTGKLLRRQLRAELGAQTLNG